MNVRNVLLSQEFPIKGQDFSHAGNISGKIKELLQEVGISTGIIRRAAIASYEAEMNVVMYANQGNFKFHLTPHSIRLRVEDKGKGIHDIQLAMKEGYSTATDEHREMGFGAGMGLPNIKRNSDRFKIRSQPGSGTVLDITIYVNQPEIK
jgi:anti-sigma regulatory factor (Ser/Thr protein kinase)